MATHGTRTRHESIGAKDESSETLTVAAAGEGAAGIRGMRLRAVAIVLLAAAAAPSGTDSAPSEDPASSVTPQAFVRIDANGTVTLTAPRLEMGQDELRQDQSHDDPVSAGSKTPPPIDRPVRSGPGLAQVPVEVSPWTSVPKPARR